MKKGIVKLYHKDVMWKPYFNRGALALITKDLKPSYHLLKHIDKQNNKHEISLDMLSDIMTDLYYDGLPKYGEVIEVETTDRTVTKALFRLPYDNNKDICIVVRYGIVVTCWLQDIMDLHNTLDIKKYSKK